MKGNIKPPEVVIDLSTFYFFQKLSNDELNKLKDEANCVFYKRGSFVYHEGKRLTGFYCITQGVVKVYKTGVDGKEQIIRFAKKGDIIAYRSLVSQETACTTAKVISDATLYYIPYKCLLYLIEQNPKFSLAMLKIVCAELKDANAHITNIAQKTVKERLAEVLLLLKDDFDLDKDKTLQISLTREDLANMVGTATESVIRLLSEFNHDNLIELHKRKIKLVDIARLTKIANL